MGIKKADFYVVFKSADIFRKAFLIPIVQFCEYKVLRSYKHFF